MKLIYSVHKCDVFIFTRLINAGFYKNLVIAARYISRTGDGYLYLLLMTVLYVKEGWNSPFLQVLLLAFFIERPLYYVLKNSFKRNRPQAAIKDFHSLVIPSDQFSFPSGHTSAAFMVASISGFFIPVLLFPLLFWAALVGFSRVVLGVHFPTDTLVGMILGVSVAIYSLNQLIL
ncbi:Type II phosphatidic acid phosphatase [Methyloprofundus sedimenti]|uniref:undecaprenyl-diphosphate phosphatase n=1 Tax=Methyloprofundus sedimenti TaxID=1420851 RepID=A0A1V8MA49_9GAMM|nr:phosphatase PAP2 family protein [Methyloprofundus sedimenti]OQK18435.1 Type II phosphatidic acid phosphatase [Methyloprofundus sedimenti]